jgi:hypothetical protein
MIFPGRTERMILADLEKGLRQENPDLVGRFDVFERLSRDEGPPPPEPRNASEVRETRAGGSVMHGQTRSW